MRPLGGKGRKTPEKDDAKEETGDSNGARGKAHRILLQRLARFWFSAAGSGADIFFIGRNHKRHKIDEALAFCRREA